MSAACASVRTAVHRCRRPEHTVQTHLATWLELSCDGHQGASGPAPVEREFRWYLECGILVHGFARARCAECGHDFLIAWSCKGRAVCPACHTRRRVETAAHLADPVFPRLPVRQWVLSVPKRLRDQPGPGGSVSVMLMPLELIERLAAQIPPPRRHRHRYYRVLAPNAPLREQVAALAGVPDGTPAAAATAAPSRSSEGTEEAIHSRIARHAWARLLARIDDVFPLVCPRCGGERRIIAFITDAAAVRDILTHLGEPTSPPRLMRARAPQLWERQGATLGEDEAQSQPAPEYEFDQRIAG